MKILIGVVLRPQGIQGEIKISNLTDGIAAVKKLSAVYIDDAEYKVMKISERDGCLYLYLRGIADRNAAEALRGRKVLREKSEIIKDKDAFFIADVIGCELYLTSGKKVGVITNVYSSNVDVFEVDADGDVVSFPFIKALKPEVDVENKKIVVDEERFSEVAVGKGGEK